jgi:glycosyltransferase involved in cell wall biosynthesis
MAPDAPRTRLLWVAPKFPLGAPDGARQATCSLIRSAVRKGADVDLVCVLPEGEPADPEKAKKELNVRSCALIRRSGSRFFPLPGPWTPFTFRTFAAGDVRREFHGFLDRAIAAGPKPAVVFDGLHTFAALADGALSRLAARAAGIVYRAHNVEAALWDQCAERARQPWMKLFFRWQAALVRRFETRVVRQASLTATVSPDDADKLRLWAPAGKFAVVPIGMEFPSEKEVKPLKTREELPLLFLGRLDWLPNRSGLQWFLSNVWRELKEARPGIRLRIAGSGDGAWLRKMLPIDGVEFLGRVDRLPSLYERSALALAPIFQGSGTRVKIIESARYARPVITTRLGAEGVGLTPGASYYRAENREEWLGFLKTVTAEQCRETGLKAFRALREGFNADDIAARFLRTLEGLNVEP